ncbi:SAC3/GANP/Nin1/mts3/eIF-3 p25 family-domain-containing protein [Dichotomopilus funicola]|uniref:SAC3/GANP/Nin1/mts3/eIF-3 p25 family-domain-containing protein n=1 Tax=Dichotomopilus funicola TaxID=1934379 RepID=A0AAN6V939_9PEZI|nr:SAC3/GANP/Nin1/mts3/eIF-3 p25 family-domain-containing protein [Dichotomopilus funicola]
MAAPANNPFGAPPTQVHNPFGAPPSAGPSAPPFNPIFSAPAPTVNPFAAATSAQVNPFGAPAPPGTANNAPSAAVPFGAPTGPKATFGNVAGNRQQSPGVQNKPFPAGPANNNRLAAPLVRQANKRSPSPLATQPPHTAAAAAFQSSDSNAMGHRNKFAGNKQPAAAVTNGGGFAGRGGPAINGGLGGRGGHAPGPQHAAPTAPTTAASNPFAKQPFSQGPTSNTTRPQRGGKGRQAGRQERYQPTPSQPGGHKTSDRGPSERTKQLSNFAFNYANRLYDHLNKENLHPPKWHADPGDPSKRAAIDNLKEQYKKYRTRVYATLRKADLIDDPDKRRKLEDALPFKGICESMCPEFEQVSRIAEYDVKSEEKEMRPDGVTMWPDTARMVKKFGRSAAGQDAPLPMDVRSIDALRRTTDYLFNDMLQSESNLPAMHNFLWDRTRAVRKDFTFHSQKSSEEMKDVVYCFETIARFHATALHLLSRKGFANEDFDQKQEIEQLGRTILSLIEAYDVCRDKGFHCDNEPEFRAYYLLLNAHDPSIARRIPTWGKEYWFDSEEMQTALSLIQAMDDVREPKGPIKPRVATTLSDTSFTNYFSIVEDVRVSYTMACIAEVHFTSVRQGILKNLVRGYARHRDAPRTITAADLNAMLRFDTPEEAVEFAELHNFEFSTWVPEGKNPVSEPYLLINNKKKPVPSPRVRQSFSGSVVERKRTTQSLPYVIYNTIFEEESGRGASTAAGAAATATAKEGDDQLFVPRAQASENLSMASEALTTPTMTPPAFGTAAASPFGTATPSSFGAAASNSPFSAGVPSTATATAASTPAFPGFAPKAPATPSNNPFGAPPASQTLPGQTPFPTFNQPAASTTTSQPAPAAPFFSQPGQTAAAAATPAAASPFAATNPAGMPAASTPSFFGQTAGTQTPAAQPPAPLFPSSTVFKPSAASTPGQTTAPVSVAEPAPTTTPAFPTSTLGSATPSGGAPLFPTTTTPALLATQQPTSTTPAIPAVQVFPPSSAASTTPSSIILNSQSQPPTSTPSFPALGLNKPFQPASTPAVLTPPAPPPPPPPPPKKDLLGDFTKWYVTGDDGLFEQFTEEILRHMLWDVWEDFGREEAERKRREEDEESWRQAREYQTYRLRIKYLYRWRNIARSLATRRILREGKEKLRLHREQEKIAYKRLQERQEKADREARRAAKRRLWEDTNRLSQLASSGSAASASAAAINARRRGSVAFSADDHSHAEEQLIASGILTHLRDDPRSIARRVVQGSRAVNNHNNSTIDDMASATRSYRYPESELELEPAPSDTSSVVGGGGGEKREGWKTRSLREKFGLEPRRSLSASGSVANGSRNGDGIMPPGSLNRNHRGSFSSSTAAAGSSRFRQSLPPGSGTMTRTTNFSRKRSAEEESDEEPGAKRLAGATGGHGGGPSGFSKSTHWDLRARGFVPMPDGNWVPEAMAKSSSNRQFSTTSSSSPDQHIYTDQNDNNDTAVVLPDDDDQDQDIEMASVASGTGRGTSRAGSPTPSAYLQMRLRLARLRQDHHQAQPGSSSREHSRSRYGGVGSRHSVDPHLPLPTGSFVDHHSHYRLGDRAGAGAGGDTALDGLDVIIPGSGVGANDTAIQRGRSVSVASRRSIGSIGSSMGSGVTPGRAETAAMVENTKRMLRELRETMDRADQAEREGNSMVG